ncbi:hypothetical protein [Caldimonas tepidiphila]|uniref:hypothetical protein n=1 Tax=Caldimonas tepidiphila TaxID=2315841 RepID=UPI000E5A63FB|nr:hypothetical protein [Caldimonas tepidiphila]
MAHSNIAGSDDIPQQAAGRSTADLGPSDTTDSGSDIIGAEGVGLDTADDLDSGTTSDSNSAAGAGLDIGDANLDSDSDSTGTGERRAAGRDNGFREADDISPDQITRDPGGLLGGEDPGGIGVSSDRDDPRRTGELDLADDLDEGRYAQEQADQDDAAGSVNTSAIDNSTESLGYTDPENEQDSDRDRGIPVGGGGGTASQGRSGAP